MDINQMNRSNKQWNAKDAALFSEIRKKKPLVHAITNPVTVTDVVNLILASGGSAICAEDPEEVADISAISDVTLVNIGMPSDRKLQAMVNAGRKAEDLGHPLILDPVGAGASAFRKKILDHLLTKLHPACIRGNASEMAALAGLVIPSRGVEDAGFAPDPQRLQPLAARLHTVLAVTGETDYAISPTQILESRTGTPLLKRITGSGCMLSGFLAAGIGTFFMGDASGDPEEILPLVHQSLAAYGRLASLAEEEMKAGPVQGTMTFRTLLIDAFSRAAGL